MNFQEARREVEEIWAGLSNSEQRRMLKLLTDPKQELVNTSSFTPRRGGSNGPSGPSKTQQAASAVASKRV